MCSNWHKYPINLFTLSLDKPIVASTDINRQLEVTHQERHII